MVFFISLVAKCVARLTRSCWKGKKNHVFSSESWQKWAENKGAECVQFCCRLLRSSHGSSLLPSLVFLSASGFCCLSAHLEMFLYASGDSSLSSASWILCSFSLNLTLFSLLMFQPVMIGCDKRDISLHLWKKKRVGGSDGLSDSCHLPLVTLQPLRVILFLTVYVLHIYFLLLSQVM